MLDNLVNPALTGLTGSITYNSLDVMMPSIILVTAVSFCLLLVFGAISSFIKNRKTTDYRKRIMDLYVAGTIRKLAKQDSIDLDEEFKEFIRSEKKRKAQLKELDEVIENELSEKVIDSNEKALKTVK